MLSLQLGNNNFSYTIIVFECLKYIYEYDPSLHCSFIETKIYRKRDGSKLKYN